MNKESSGDSTMALKNSGVIRFATKLCTVDTSAARWYSKVVLAAAVIEQSPVHKVVAQVRLPSTAA